MKNFKNTKRVFKSIMPILLLLIICSCSKPVDEEPLSTISFSYAVVPFEDAHGQDVPICSDSEPTTVYLKFKGIEGQGSGTATKLIDEDFVLQPGEYWLQDFEVRDADKNPVFIMPRAYQGRAFVFRVNEASSVKIFVPVHCTPQ